MTGQKCVTRRALSRRVETLALPRAEILAQICPSRLSQAGRFEPNRPSPQSAKRNAARPPKPGANAPAGQGASNAPCWLRRRHKVLEKWPNFNPWRQNFRRCAAHRRGARVPVSRPCPRAVGGVKGDGSWGGYGGFRRSVVITSNFFASCLDFAGCARQLFLPHPVIIWERNKGKKW